MTITHGVSPSLESTAATSERKRAHIIVLGNEKGGSGKTTTCMHLVVALLRLGFNVGTIDTDSRQRSFSRYVDNRKQTIAKEGVQLPVPQHIVVAKSPFNIMEEAHADERDRFLKALARLVPTNDFVVIDSPGSDTYLSRLAHSFADTVITPINDSFVDLDVLANVDGQTLKIIKPSIYSEMMWEQKLERAKRDGGTIEWIVMRNRLSNIDAKNKRFMTQVTGDLSRRLGFRVAPGFSERVIFREMFLQGVTVLDVMDATSMTLSMSHIAARQEVRDLLKTLRLAQVDKRLDEMRGAITPEPAAEEPEEVMPVAVAPAAPAAPVQKPAVPAASAPVMTTAAPAAPAETAPKPAGPVMSSTSAAPTSKVAFGPLNPPTVTVSPPAATAPGIAQPAFGRLYSPPEKKEEPKELAS